MDVKEDKLVQEAQSGNIDAFAELVRMHQQFVFNLALRVLNDPCEAEDLAQEAFVRAWQALPRFRQQAQFRTWLYRIVTNLCYNKLPRLRRELAALGDEQTAGLSNEQLGDPAHTLEAEERRRFLHRQIDALPESYRLLIVLRYQQELSYEEIVEITGAPLGTVKTGLFRARECLRDAVRRFEEVSLWKN